jgi:hypothetical protein
MPLQLARPELGYEEMLLSIPSSDLTAQIRTIPIPIAASIQPGDSRFSLLFQIPKCP